MSPRAVLKQVRAQLPDTIEALKQLPQLFQTAVREASEGRLRLRCEHRFSRICAASCRDSDSCRDIALAAGVLWLSGCLADGGRSITAGSAGCSWPRPSCRSAGTGP